MTNLYYLPEEIKDIILKDYWYDFFKSSVITELNDYIIHYEKIKEFMNNHFFKCSSKNYDRQLLYYYTIHNDFLKTVSKNRSIWRFLSNRYPSIKHIIRPEYRRSCFRDIREDLKFICVYAVTNGCPYMGYRYKQRFIDMVK